MVVVPCLLCSLPIMLLTGLAIAVKLGLPVFYKQQRPGQGGKLFMIYKFRTMVDAKDIHGDLLPDEQRLTPLGQFLRRFSLDELPELLNVLKGEMSLVGPRPLLMEYLGLYSPEQARRHEMKPGITGWAQVNGRNTVNWDERFKLDTWYIDNWSLWLDCRILGQTLLKVFTQEGISQEGEATMKKFSGNK